MEMSAERIDNYEDLVIEGTTHLSLNGSNAKDSGSVSSTIKLKNAEDGTLTVLLPIENSPQNKISLPSASSLGSSQTLTDKNSEAISERSKSSKGHSTNASGERTYTKIYYHIDDEPTPYCTKVQVAPSKITLGDFKRVLNRSNFKYYCKSVDLEVGGEVKAEIFDDSHILHKSSNGHFELFLLTTEGSSNSAGTEFFKASKNPHSVNTKQPLQSFHALSNNFKIAHKPKYDFGIAEKPKNFLTSTMYGMESDARAYSDDETRLSTSTDNITSVSRQNHSFYRRRQRRHHRRLPSRASSLSSMTETSMALEVITVTLNIDSVGFLGISIVGQSCARGDNGIYVANVMPGGAVALDGRIEPGDMILQVNDVSFEKFTNDQAVEVLKDAVNRRGTIKLIVAKSLESDRSNYFTLPIREPVRPIDTKAWVQHTNAVRGVTGFGTMNSIPEGSEGAPTPIPGQQFSMQHRPPPPLHPHNNFNYIGPPPRTAGGSNNSGGSCGGSGIQQQTVISSNEIFLPPPQQLNIRIEHKKVVYAMAMPNSGLDIRDHSWLKIPIPMSFLGTNLVDWLINRVEGLRDRKQAKKYASELLKLGLIAHVVNKSTFTEQCYYVFGDACEEFVQLRCPSSQQQSSSTYQRAFDGDVVSSNFFPFPHYFNNPEHRGGVKNGHQQFFGVGEGTARASMSGDYASMPPMSPYPSFIQTQQNLHQNPPHLYLPFGAGGGKPMVGPPFGATPVPDMKSQASNNSNEESSGSDQRRKAILPPAPSLSSVMPNDQKYLSSIAGTAKVPMQQQQQQAFAFKQQLSLGADNKIATTFPSVANSSGMSSLRFRFANENSEFFVDHL